MEDRLRYVLASLFAVLVLLCIVGIPVLLVVTSTYGLGDTVRRKVEETLGGQFYKVTVARVLFSPTRGFILDRLQIHDRTPSQRLVVSANRLAVSINLESLVRNQMRLERIFLRDATLDIPLGPTEEPRLRLDHVRGLILCPAEQFQLNSASFEVAGIAVHASGTFLNPKRFAPKPLSSEGPGAIALTIDSIQKELRSVRWEEDLPELTIEASGDLSDSESLRVERAVFHSGPASWHGVRLHEADLTLHYEGRKLSLEKALFNDGTGILQAQGWADFAANKASAEFTGAFNAGVLPTLLLSPKKAADWHCIDPLRLNGRFSAAWGGGPPVLEGNVLFESGRFQFRGIGIDSFSGGVALQAGKVLVRDLRLEGEPGKLNADFLIAPGDNRLRLKASLYPGKIAPATTGKTQEALAAMDFKEPLNLSFEGGASERNPLMLKGEGTLNVGKASMRGAAIESLSSKLQIEGGAATFREIVVRMTEGIGRGEFVYDFKNWEGRLSKIHTTLDPVKVMTWIDPRIADAMKEYRFNKPPELQVSGKVGLRNPDKNDLRIAINAPAGLDYTLLKKNLRFGATGGTVLLKRQKLFIDVPSSHLFGGGVSLKADVSVAPGDGNYGASVHLENVDFQTLTKLYFGYDESKGQLTADYAFRDVGAHERAMTGKGHLLIRNGNVLAMPILGPLSVLIGDIIPGFGYQSAHKAAADFTVANGIITTHNLLIQGTGFSMIGHGDIYYLDDRMEMNIRLNAQGLPGLVLFPVSKIFEYESVGSAKHPKWRPKIIPKHL